MRGAAVRSVRQPPAHAIVERSPSTPPPSGPLAAAVRFWLPPVSAATLIPFPAVPMARDRMVSVRPATFAHTAVAPALIASASALATLAAVSAMKLMCLNSVPPMLTVVYRPKSGVPASVTVAEAYCCPGHVSS